MTTDNTDDLTQAATDAFEAIRALNHGTFQTVPAPTTYSLLGDLRGVGHGLDQLCRQLASGLERSLSEYDVYDHNRDPVESVAMAATALREAARQATRVGELLSAAQLAINLQGYHGSEDHR